MNRAEKRRLHKQIKKTGGTAVADPRLAEAMDHHRDGRLTEAEAAYRRILADDPRQSAALHLLGVVALQRGRPDVAADLIGRSLDLRSDVPQPHCDLGNALAALGRWDDALAAYRRAIALKADFIAAHNALAALLRRAGRSAETVEALRRVADLTPGDSRAHLNLGNALKETGDMDGAAACFAAVLRLNPNHAEARHHIAHIRKVRADDDNLRAMEALAARPGLPVEDRAFLAFGLGKAYEDLGDFPRAFDRFAEGNAAERSRIAYSTDKTIAFFTAIKEVFSADLLARHSTAGCDDETPIFILGMPRSGTSLVEQILASHPDVCGAGELEFLREVADGAFPPVDGQGYPRNVAAADPVLFARAGQAYIAAIRRFSPSARFITDKMPDNFIAIGLIRLILPRSKIIHCTRDPMDNCLSIYKNFFGPGVYPFAYDQTELGHYYAAYRDLMDHWRAVLPPGILHEVRYEDMVADQEATSRALLAHCGLPWTDACLHFHRTERAVTTASLAQVRRPIYRDSVAAWKRYEDRLAPLAAALASR